MEREENKTGVLFQCQGGSFYILLGENMGMNGGGNPIIGKVMARLCLRYRMGGFVVWVMFR